MSVTVFGSIILDLLFPVPMLPKAGETVAGDVIHMAPGGKGANQALAAQRAGAPSRLVGAVGDDGFAASALFGLKRAGVDLSAVRKVPGATGCAAIGIDRAGENQIMVALGANLEANADDIPPEWVGPGDILLTQAEVPLAQTARALARARSAGTVTCLNLAPFRPVDEALFALIDLLVVNESEAASLARHLGSGETASELARRLGSAVIVTLGADGADWARGDDSGHVHALAVEIVDTTGAGDAFVGALAASLNAGLPLDQAVARAAIAGSLSCRALGAQASLPDADEIDGTA